MSQRASLSSIALAALLAAAIGPAQAQSDFAAVSGGTVAPNGGGIPGPDVVLWDNTAVNSTTGGIVSLKAEDLPAGADLVNTADDFVVPGDEQWTVTFVFSTGFASAGTIDADGFEVFFYEDAGGLPGTLISSQQVPFGAPVTMDEQQITLPSPVSLQPGTYWVSVAAVYDPFVDLATTRWNWFTGPTAIGNTAALQDTGGFFGPGNPWTDLPTLGVTDVSTVFALRGTTIPFAQGIPTLGTGGMIVLVLLLAGIAVVTMRRVI